MPQRGNCREGPTGWSAPTLGGLPSPARFLPAQRRWDPAGLLAALRVTATGWTNTAVWVAPKPQELEAESFRGSEFLYWCWSGPVLKGRRQEPELSPKGPSRVTGETLHHLQPVILIAPLSHNVPAERTRLLCAGDPG